MQGFGLCRGSAYAGVRLIQGFYIKVKYPAVLVLLERVKEEEIYNGSRFCLWKLVHSLAFSYKKKVIEN